METQCVELTIGSDIRQSLMLIWNQIHLICTYSRKRSVLDKPCTFCTHLQSNLQIFLEQNILQLHQQAAQQGAYCRFNCILL